MSKPTVTTETRYLAHFDGQGYYAEKQPNYEWSFTDDVNKALWYKTAEKAQDRVIWGGRLISNPVIGSVQAIEVITSVTLVSKTLSTKEK